MKYFEFEKKAPASRVVSVILNTFVIVVAPSLIYMIVLFGIFSTSFDIEEVSPWFLLISYFIWLAACVIFVIRRLHELKGVFLYDDHFEIVPAFMQGTYPVNKKFKEVSYDDILKIEYVGRFHRDKASSWGKYSFFTYNFLGGRSSNCIKIVLTSNETAFFSCENNIELMQELRSRMPISE